MSEAGREARTDEIVRAEAIAWLTRLRSPDGADDHETFQDWYAADPRHADIYDDVLGTWDSTALAARTPAGEMPRRFDSKPTRPRYRMAVAAVAALVLVVLSGIGLQRFGAFGPGRTDPAEVASRIGEIRTVTLADGSRVTLDTNSALAIAYTAGERRLTLEHGRARFDVAHDPARPFVVTAGSGMIIAHGTLFDVDLQQRRVTVSLLRGSVEVRNEAAGRVETARTGRLLKPGQRLALEQHTPMGSPVALRASETRWPSGMLSFEDASLAEVVAAANRYNSAQIILADRAIGALRFTGTFAARDAQGLARMLSATFNLDLSHDDHGSLILAPRR
ncbi:FecR family protein [Flavisphingomonas formosensis]|uniref:FecR family protein n=1 Tax=Flavisphingomonas formosensis TaxID=861534 RepID=UPI0012F7DD65|nr:FecR domain-containing protein [Sphingomonas formosensis]